MKRIPTYVSTTMLTDGLNGHENQNTEVRTEEAAEEEELHPFKLRKKGKKSLAKKGKAPPKRVLTDTLTPSLSGQALQSGQGPCVEDVPEHQEEGTQFCRILYSLSFPLIDLSHSRVHHCSHTFLHLHT